MVSNPHEEAVQAALQHDPEVVAKQPIPGAQGRAKTWVYHARCSCGWMGEERLRHHHADDDVSVHLRTVLPDDQPGSIYR